MNGLTGTGPNSISALERKIKELECKLEALESQNRSLGQSNDSLQSRLDESVKRIGELTLQQKPDCEDSESMKAELESLRKQLAESEQKRNKVKRDLQISENILSAVDKDRTKISEQKWDQLSDYIYELLGYDKNQAGCNPLLNEESDSVGIFCSSMDMLKNPLKSGNGKMSV